MGIEDAAVQEAIYRRVRLIALTLAVVASGCASSIDYVTGRATLNAYELEEDVELGTKMATLLIASAESLGVRVDPDDIYTRTVRTVAARILSVPENRARMPPLPWEVHVVGAADADAWCFPGGQVVIATGLLQSGLVRDEDELATIIGHEMAHAAARHGTERRTIEELRRRIAPLGSFFGARLVELANPRTPREVIEALSEDASSFDRAQEIEADIIGLEMMARAGYSAEKASEVWARIARARGDGAGLLKSHPAFADRAAQLSQHLQTIRYLKARRSSEVSAASTGWTWSEDQLGVAAPKSSLASAGALPEMIPAGALIQVSIAVHDRRATIEVETARDLYEDRLPMSVRITIEPDGYDAVVLDAKPLKAAHTQLIAKLPPLRSDASIVRARVVVGSVYGEAVSRMR